MDRPIRTSVRRCGGSGCDGNIGVVRNVYDPNEIPKKNIQLDMIVTLLLEQNYDKTHVMMSINKVQSIFQNAEILIVDKTGEQNFGKIKDDFAGIKNVEVIDVNAGFIPPPK